MEEPRGKARNPLVVKLYLLRHAQAEDAYPDFERRLTDAGRERSRLLGGYLKPFLQEAQIFTSPAPRALETAQIVAERVGHRADLNHEPGLYNGDMARIRQIIQDLMQVPVGVLVGHEPTLSELGSALVRGGAFELKPGGVIRVDFDSGHGRLRWLLDPELLERGTCA